MAEATNNRSTQDPTPSIKFPFISSPCISWWLCISLVVWALPSTACVTNSRIAKESKSLAEKLTERDALRPLSPFPEARKREVYLDTSFSMGGFVRGIRSGPRSVFVEVIRSLATSFPDARFYKFGQMGDKPPKEFTDLVRPFIPDRSLERDQFFDNRFNPDDRLFERICCNDPQTAYVYVTDAVYSDSTGKAPAGVLYAIEKCFQRPGAILAVMAFKSSYNGPFYSESRRQWIGSVTVKERPFYLFVFSPNGEAYASLRNKLKRQFPHMRSFVFSEIVATSRLEFPKDTKGIYSHVDEPYDWRMVAPSPFAKANPYPFSFMFRCALDADYTVQDLDARVQVETYRWNKRGFEKVNTLSQIKVETKILKSLGAEKLCLIEVTLLIPRDPKAEYTFYHVKMMPYIKNLRPEISALSTSDDGALREARKTYLFQGLMDSLTDLHYRTRVAPKLQHSLFITVANK